MHGKASAAFFGLRVRRHRHSHLQHGDPGPVLAFPPAALAGRQGRIPLAIITSELTLLETLVGPLRSADAALVTAYEQLFQSSEIRLVPISKDVLREAARLRAVIPGLRTPDALHAATAELTRCTMFLSNDTGFRRVPDLPITILDEALKAP